MGLISRVSSRTYRFYRMLSTIHQTVPLQSPIVEVTVTTTTSGFQSFQKLNRSLSILDLKCKFEMVTGIPAANQKLSLYDSKDKLICNLSNNDQILENIYIDDNFRIHVDSEMGVGGIVDFNDTTNVQKYELDEEDYDKKRGTVRDFKRRNKLGRFNVEESAKLEQEKLQKEQEYNTLQQAALKKLKLESRCKVTIPKSAKRLGIIKYLGKLHFSPLLWAGIEYDDPVGKNDGEVKGKRYFTCKQKFGGFVKVENVECGDFPPEDDFDDLDDIDEI